MTRRIIVAPLLLGAVTLAIAACGSDDNNDSSSSSASTPASTPAAPASTTPATSGGGASTFDLTATEGGSTAFGFDPKDGTAKAGNVTLTLDNPSSNQAPHAIAIEGNGIDKDGTTAQPGGKSTVTVDLKPGKYEYYCPVGGHRQAGMQGELVVK